MNALPQSTATAERVARSGPLPLSSSQRQMWLLYQMAPSSQAYLMTWTLRLTGRLDVEALIRAWTRLAERHEILRTRYRQDGDVPCQLVDPPGPVAIRLIDLAAEPEARREQRAQQIADWEQRRPFDLSAQQPLRVSLIAGGPRLHYLVVSIHHIACDDVSARIIAAELDALYSEETGGAPADLAEDCPQYTDYAVSERAQDAEGEQRGHLDYWRAVLAGAPNPELPLDRPRSAAQTDRRAGVVELEIEPATVDAARALAAERRATPFIVLLAAYHVMLAQLNNADDVSIGYPVTTRTPDLENVLGYMVNTVVSRLPRTVGRSFADVVSAVRGSFLDAYAHRGVPFEQVVDALNPAREAGASPLFRAAIDIADVDPSAGFRLAGLQIENVGELTAAEAKFDLTLHLGEHRDGRLSARLEYAAALIDEESVRSWAQEWRRLLETLVLRPAEAIGPGPGMRRGASQSTDASAVDSASPAASGALAEAASALATTMCRVWAEVLEKDDVGVQDNFFDVGGDSIRAVVLAGRLRVEDVEVTAADIFACQSIEELAERCAGRVRSDGSSGGADLPAPVAPFSMLCPEDRLALPDDVCDAYPLTAVQRGMLVELMARPGVNTYQDTTSYVVRDPEPFDIDALQAATQRVVDRHEVLRTSFELDRYSVPLQLVHRTAGITVGFDDHGELGPDGWRPAFVAFAARERRRLMDFTRPPLIRVHAHTARDRPEWSITITECHPILEGWSFHTMLMEIIEGYREIRAGREPAEPETKPPFRYVDYVASELAARNSEQGRAFWRGVIEGRSDVAVPLAWQGDRSQPRERYLHTLDFRDLEDDLRRLAAETRTSLKAVLLAANIKVMSMIAAREDVYMGLVCDGRPEAVGADRVLGMYLNTVPFAMPAGAGTWGELVRAVYEGLTDLWPYRAFPMPVMQQELGSGGRLLEIFYNFTDFHQVDKNLIDWDATFSDSDNEFALHVYTAAGTLRLNTTTHQLSRDGAARLASLYRAVLEQMALGPDGTSQAAWLPQQERERLELLDRRAEASGELPAILDAFARSVREHPADVAARCGANELTYAQLDAEVEQRARELTLRGFDAGSVIEIAPERSLDTIGAMLAAWRIGAAWTPADPGSPQQGAVRVPVTQAQVAAGVERLRDGLRERGMASKHAACWLSAADPTSSHGAVELFAALTSGGTVHLTAKALPDAIPEMRALISAGQVTHLYTAPLVAASVLDECRCERPVCVVVASPTDTSKTAVLAGRSVENARVIEAIEIGGVFGPVGFGGNPAVGVSLHVVDQMSRPIPLGVPGELCVGLGGPDAGELVHTGRAARVGIDGTVELLGAIGGYYHTRELIEMLPAVRDCRIVAREDGESRPRAQLVCYARIEAGAAFEPDYISTLLSERRAPRHLVPDAVVVVDEWPLTASGDVDLAALPQPADPAASGQAGSAPPWDEQFERILREVFGDGFAQAVIEPDVPLVDAGLNSVGMVSLLVAIEEEYELVIPDEFEVVDAFRTPRTLWRQIGRFRQEQQG